MIFLSFYLQNLRFFIGEGQCLDFLEGDLDPQMKGWYISSIDVWFQFMYSQKWNCPAFLFPKQNCNVLSPNFHIHVSVCDLYIPRISLPILMQLNRQTDRSRIHECRNWEGGHAVSFLGIQQLNPLLNPDKTVAIIKYPPFWSVWSDASRSTRTPGSRAGRKWAAFLFCLPPHSAAAPRSPSCTAAVPVGQGTN